MQLIVPALPTWVDVQFMFDVSIDGMAGADTAGASNGGLSCPHHAATRDLADKIRQRLILIRHKIGRNLSRDARPGTNRTSSGTISACNTRLHRAKRTRSGRKDAGNSTWTDNPNGATDCRTSELRYRPRWFDVARIGIDNAGNTRITKRTDRGGRSAKC